MHINPDELFHALSDLTRLRALVLLQAQGELCVCELTYALDAPQPKVSRHLGILREMGLVSDRRQGLWIYYSINPALPIWARTVIDETARGVASKAPFAADGEKLKDMPNRPDASCCA